MSIKSQLKLSEMMAFENKLQSIHTAAEAFSKNIARLICGLKVFPLAVACKLPVNFSAEAA